MKFSPKKALQKLQAHYRLTEAPDRAVLFLPEEVILPLISRFPIYDILYAVAQTLEPKHRARFSKTFRLKATPPSFPVLSKRLSLILRSEFYIADVMTTVLDPELLILYLARLYQMGGAFVLGKKLRSLAALPKKDSFVGYHAFPRKFVLPPNESYTKRMGFHAGTVAAALDIVSSKLGDPDLVYLAHVSIKFQKAFGSASRPAADETANIAELSMAQIVKKTKKKDLLLVDPPIGIPLFSSLREFVEAGYDGAFYENMAEDAGSISVVTFHAKNVKQIGKIREYNVKNRAFLDRDECSAAQDFEERLDEAYERLRDSEDGDADADERVAWGDVVDGIDYTGGIGYE